MNHIKYRDFEIANTGEFMVNNLAYQWTHKDWEPLMYKQDTRCGTEYDLFDCQKAIDEWYFEQDPCIANIKWIEVDSEDLQVNDIEIDGNVIYFLTRTNKYATEITGYHEPSGQYESIDWDNITKE